MSVGAGCICKRSWRSCPNRVKCWAVRWENPLCALLLRQGRHEANAGSALNEKRMSGCAWSGVWKAFPPRPPVCMSETLGQICFPFSRPAERPRPIFWCEPLRTDGSSQKRAYRPICEGAVRAWPATASRPLQVPTSHGRTARSTVVQLAYGVLTVLPPREDQTLWQRPADRLGCAGVGRANPSRRGALGMDSADLGAHHDA